MSTIKKETLKKSYPDLTHIEGSVTQVINTAYNRLSILFEDPNITDDEFISIIILLIEQATETKKQQEILNIAQSKTSRLELFEYITNVWLKGQNLGVL